MNTNNEDTQIPDIAFLERLANQLFNQTTDVADSGTSPSVSRYSNSIDKQTTDGISLPETPTSQQPAAPFPQYGYDPSQENGAGIAVPAIATIPVYPGNGLYTAVPSSAMGTGLGISPSVSQYNIPADNTGGREANARYFNESAIIPSSVAGSGTSPSVSRHSNPIAVKDQNTTRYYSDNGGRIPASLAGSGASPSVVEHGNNINIKDPQTGFPDKNLSSENISSPDQRSFQEEEGSVFHFLTPSAQLPITSIYDLREVDPVSRYYFLEPDAGQNPVTSFPDNRVLRDKSNSSNGDAVPWAFDANLIKQDFPILNESVNGRPLIWLDNAATTQKPKLVIDRVNYFYKHENSNIHRAAHELAARATDAYETARKKVQAFINATSANEVVFVRGATEAINLVAKSWGEQYLQAGDEIILSHLEHHANIVPWQQLAAKKNLRLRVIPVDNDGQVLLDEYAKLLNPRTKLVSFTYVSNALGTITPAKAIIEMAHLAGAKVLLDGAQSVSHIRTDVRALDADWFVFSGHKVFGYWRFVWQGRIAESNRSLAGRWKYDKGRNFPAYSISKCSLPF
jgi:hypothetical protein